MDKVLFWIEVVADILVGLLTIIPLVIALVKAVKKWVQEKNWSAMLAYALELMKAAELRFDNGADKKAWVMNMVQAASKNINYEVNDEALGSLIDAVISATNCINVTPNDEDAPADDEDEDSHTQPKLTFSLPTSRVL